MILYYSGANAASLDQNNPDISLGGFVSVTSVPNASLNNIFATISKSMVVGNKRDTRLVVLRNTLSTTAYNVRLYIDNTIDDVHSRLILAAVSPAIDGCGNPYFEQINSTEALPYQATLVSANGLVNAIEIGDMASGDNVGIWLSRSIAVSQFPTANGATNGTSTEAIQALEDSIANPITQDNNNLVILWDSVQTTTTTTTAAP